MLPVSSVGRIALVLVRTSLSVVLMRWLLLLLARSRIGGSLLIYVLLDVVLALGDACSWSSVDDFCSIWSTNAEAGLFRAYCRAGGPTAAGSPAFLGRRLLRIRGSCLGGRAVGGRGSSRLYRASQGDEFDVHCAEYFVNPSLAPVVLFRRRLKSVADVLKEIRTDGFTQSRWDALLGYWSAVCRCGPPWDGWIPPHLHVFFRWVFDSLRCSMASLIRLSSVVGILRFVSGLIGFGRIWVREWVGGWWVGKWVWVGVGVCVGGGEEEGRTGGGGEERRRGCGQMT